jgi:hypothetical protein
VSKRRVLRGVHVNEVALVDGGDNPGARILLYKRHGAALGKATKRENGLDFRAGDYAYTPDAEKPGTWKLRLAERPGTAPTARQVGRAVAALGSGGFRGQRVEIPASDLMAVKRRVLAAWLKANPDEGRDAAPAVLKALAGRTATELDAESLGAAWAGLEALPVEEPGIFEKWLGPLLVRLAALRKEHDYPDEEPRSFDDVRADWSAMQSMGVIGDRLEALRSAVFEILHSEAEDKEALVRQSLDQFSEEMGEQVGEILAGRIAKALGSNPDPSPGGGDAMPFDVTKLPEALRGLFAKVKLEALPAEAKAALDAMGDAYHKAATDKTAADAAAAAAKAELEKRAKPTDPDDSDPVLKALSPEARTAVKAERERVKVEHDRIEKERAADRKRIEKLEADATRERLAKRAAPYVLFGKKPEELTALFEKAEAAGLLDELDAAFKVAHAQAEKGKVLEELGSGAGVFTGSAVEEIRVAAQKIRASEPKLSEAQAFTKAMRENPELAKRHRAEQLKAGGVQ